MANEICRKFDPNRISVNDDVNTQPIVMYVENADFVRLISLQREPPTRGPRLILSLGECKNNMILTPVVIYTLSTKCFNGD